jgi:hypothetical protein
MLKAVPLLSVTLLLISVFAYFLASIQLADIRRNWDERRCDPLVIMIAHMIPTKPDPDFSSNNFNFCMSEMMKSSLALFTAPMMAVFGKQMDVASTASNSVNTLRGTATSYLGPLNTIISAVWKKSMVAMYQVMRIFGRMHDAIGRIYGIVLATLFAGMSSFRGFQNAIGFVIQVCIAIIVILVILAIIAWYIMWPVIPMILTTIGLISTTVYAANVTGMADSFCVAPGTEVQTVNGWKAVELLAPGERLKSGRIEGVLHVRTTPDTRCVRLNGVILSTSHLVWHEDAWRPAGECTGAVRVDAPAELYCLNTTNRIWVCRGNLTGERLLLRDWEELPDASSSPVWDAFIFTLLNPGIQRSAPLEGGRGLLGRDTVVLEESRGTVSISDVRLGDRIRMSPTEWTRVVGLYKDTAELQPASGPNAHVWSWIPELGQWDHTPRTPAALYVKEGWHLVTESGVFEVWFKEGHACVRDFTEVGADRIHETYSYTAELLS